MVQTQFMSAIEAAKRLEVGLDYLYSLLWVGRIKGQKNGRKWEVDAASVAEYQKRLALSRGQNQRDHKSSK